MNTPMTPTPRLVPDRPSDAASQFDGFSAANVVRMLDEWAADQREREAWNDGDKSTYTFRAGLLQTAANRLREAAAPPAEAPADAHALIAEIREAEFIDSHKVGDWIARAAALAAAPAGDLYRQACDSVEEWKARALTAEADIARLHAAFNAENGPTRMGEPVLTAAPAAPAEGDRSDALEMAEEDAALEGEEAPRVTGGREDEALREALADLISWFPDAPAPAEWRIPAGGSGADDAIAAAHAALGHKTCRFCGWRGTPETAADPYTTDGTVEVCGGCNNAESCA